MTTQTDHCTHGGDCPVHPDAMHLHDFSPGSGVAYYGRRPATESEPEFVGSARLIMTAPEIEADPVMWKAQRRTDETGNWRLTASEMASVLNMTPDSQPGPFSLYHAKVDGIDTFDGNDRTEFGLYAEDFIASKFAAANPDLEVGPGGLYVSKRWPWLGATFDRIAYGMPPLSIDPGQDQGLQPAGPVQLKSWAQRADFGQAGSDVIPLHLRVQLLVEMAVLGTDIAYEPVVFLPSAKVITYVIERDGHADRDIAAIVAAGEEFITRLNEENPPDVDWRPATRITLQRLYEQLDDTTARVPVRLARRLRSAYRARDAADRRFKLAQNEVRARAGNSAKVVAFDPGAGEDRTVVTRSGGGRSGYSVAPKDYIETMRLGNWGTK